MKRYSSLLMGILGFVPILAQQSEYYYYYKGERIDLTVDSTHLYVVSEGEFQPQSVSRASTEYSVSKSAKSYVYNNVVPLQKQRTATPEVYFSTLDVPEGTTSSQYDALVAKVRSEKDVWQVLPSFTSDGKPLNISNNIYVKLKSAEDLGTLQQMAAQYGLEIIGNNEFMPLWYTLSCNSTSTKNAIEAANLFYATGLFAHSEPEICGQLTFTSLDEYYEQQWNLKNTGQTAGLEGIDINVEGAWEITKGAGAVVAVYDEALYAWHEDLSDNMHDYSYDIFTGGISSYDINTNGNHGNRCAGIIAAVQGNDKGISGISPESKLMSISFGESSETNQLLVSSKVANGFLEAYKNGADIISCSWGYNGYQEYIDEAIECALDSGRNNKGCIIVFAAGNDEDGGIIYYDENNNPFVLDETLGDDVGYPANCNPRILTVGGINSIGERTKYGFMPSGRYETWSSNFGSELDVVAPSVEIYTTSYPKTLTVFPSYYYGAFNGTSAACPHAAAVAALILSVHPDLTADQVVGIIEYTAKKVRPDLYNYQTNENRPHGGWNEEMGYGLIDAEAAVMIADKATRTTYISNRVIGPSEHFYDYDVEVEDVLVEDGGLLELDKDHSVILKRNIIVQEGGQLIVYKDPDFLKGGSIN